LRETEGELQAQRQALAQWETRQRLLSREARSGANRESERALALAEEARDLDGLIGELDAAASLRRELAALPGPILRPGTGGEAAASPRAPAPSPTAVVAQASSARPPLDFQLPVQGRTVAGFGVQRDSGLRSAGITLAPSPGAQVVAPATGRIAFAGLYRGYGRIVIIEHEGGWTTLVTGLARVSVEVGDSVIGGSPLGVATSSDAIITLELRQSGEAVNPLQFLT
jgi:septal ring factor EnvC (AmiA/AmiB activator)